MDVLIIHYNTPQLTCATIRSLLKQTPKAKVTIFDNSDVAPFPFQEFGNIRYIDNTQGRIVDWGRWLQAFPDKMPCLENNYGSAKHCYSVELCYDMFPDGFVLMDSDVLIKKDITPICDMQKAFVGRVHCNTRQFGIEIYRVCPWLCWINIPMLKEYGIRYFNKDYMWKLHSCKPNGFYDTGAWFLHEVKENNLPYDDIEIFEYIIHLRAASWRKKQGHSIWLNNNKALWE